MTHYSDIVLEPVITEKTTDLNQHNVYTFKVNKKATKTQVKKAIEEAFGVKVKKVNTINTTPKKKRVGRYAGKTQSIKKALVFLEEGQSIEI